MTSIRHSLLSGLALLVLVTSMGIAMARGAMAADGQICSATGAPTLVLAHDGLPLLDEDGHPVVLEHAACLDCLMGALADAPRHAGLMIGQDGVGIAQRPGQAVAIITRITGDAQARAPPPIS